MPENLGYERPAERQRQPFLFGNIFFFSATFFRFTQLSGDFVVLHIPFKKSLEKIQYLSS